MKITDHIYFYPSLGKNLVESSGVTIIRGKDKQVIIDPGTNIKKRLEYLVTEMNKDGIDINKIDEIWLTHAHPDHFQMIHDLYKRLGRKILVRCHPAGKKILADPIKENFYSREIRKGGKYYKIVFSAGDMKKFGRSAVGATENLALMTKRGLSKIKQKIINTKSFFDGEILSIPPIKIQTMFLPGHTPDEIGFWIAKRKILIVGDLVYVDCWKDDKIDCKLVLYNFYADLSQALISLNKMKYIKRPKILLTSHSAPIKGKKNIQRIFEQLISKIDYYKVVASAFSKKHQGLNDIKLIESLAKEFLDNLSLVERRFVALATLKSLGVIK